MDAQFDILIIGSGAGGGTVASALAPLCAEGARVAVLEWGPHFNDDEFTGRELEMAEKLFFDSGAIGNRDPAAIEAHALLRPGGWHIADCDERRAGRGRRFGDDILYGDRGCFFRQRIQHV